MEAGKFSFKFSRQTQKNLVGSSKYAYFSRFYECDYAAHPDQPPLLFSATAVLTSTPHVSF
jgi:hypothetical protein